MSNERRLLPLALISLAVALPALHGQDSQSPLEKKWAAKQQESWFQEGGWIHDFDAAKAKAAKEGKLVFAYFSRSYSP